MIGIRGRGWTLPSQVSAGGHYYLTEKLDNTKPAPREITWIP